MAETGQSAFAEPMSMQDALERADTLTRAAAEKPVEAEEVEDDQTEAEDAEDISEEDPDAEEPEGAEEESDQILTADEYGDVLVDVDGEPTPLKDVLKGTLRQADYTRKTQALKDQEKQLLADFEAREKKLEAREQQLEQMAAELEDPEPDWEALADDDPLGWASAKAKWDKKQKAKQQREQELSTRREKQRQDFTRKTVEVALEKMPEWADQGKFEAGADARRQAAMDAGFTAEEYESTIDYRLAVVLEKAARYDAMSSDTAKKRVSAEKKIAAAPKVLRPGQAKGDTDPAAERRAARQKRFSKPISSEEIKRMAGIR